MMLAIAVHELRRRSGRPRLRRRAGRRAAAVRAAAGAAGADVGRSAVGRIRPSPPTRARFASCRCRSGCVTGRSRAATSRPSYQFYQTFHEKRLVGGYISRLPGNSIERYRSLPAMRVLLRLSEGTPVEPELFDEAYAPGAGARCSGCRSATSSSIRRAPPRSFARLPSAPSSSSWSRPRAASSSIARRSRRPLR